MDRLNTTPYWMAGAAPPLFPALSRDLSVDAVVVGGGITGVTAAYLLTVAGLKVALVERGRCGQGETGHTTAHLTAVTDVPFSELTRSFGDDHAAAIWDAGFAAIAEIDMIVRRERIDCDFQWVPGYLHATPGGGATDELGHAKAQAALAAAAGFDAEYVSAIPGLGLPGVRFDGQAKFHPMKYLHALLSRVSDKGCAVFEQSPVDAVTGDPPAVSVGAHTLSARFVVIATHVPIAGKASAVQAALLQTDLYPYSTYAVGARIAKGRLPEALFWDVSKPYHYLRVDTHPAHDYVVFGGADHKTGQADNTPARFEQLEETLRTIVADAEVTHRWSGQVIETRDGLPHIGETAPRQFAITGLSGNGMTFGTLGALMARDAVTGRANPWRELFDAGRTRITKGLWNYLKENKDYPYYLIRDRFAGAEGRSLRAIRRGEGRIVDLDGERVAAWRDPDGQVTLLSPVCTHLGCVVGWNQAESSWDCPCHGSRFTATGDVMAGPAERPLTRIDTATARPRRRETQKTFA